MTETVPIASRLVLWHGLGPSICAALIPSALHAVSFESRQVVSGVRVISALRAGGPVVRWFVVLILISWLAVAACAVALGVGLACRFLVATCLFA